MMQYRTHDDGPLTTIRVEPGAIVVEMEFDMPESFVRLHSHAFDHWMECVKGSALIEIDGNGRVVQAGDRYLVEAHKRHGVRPLSVGTVLKCVHEHADIHPDGARDHIPEEWLLRLTDQEADHAA